MQRIDQSSDTYFDDLQAKDATLKAIQSATSAGNDAKKLSGDPTVVHTHHHEDVHHVSHAPVAGSTHVEHSSPAPGVTQTTTYHQPAPTVIQPHPTVHVTPSETNLHVDSKAPELIIDPQTG